MTFTFVYEQILSATSSLLASTRVIPGLSLAEARLDKSVLTALLELDPTRYPE